MTLRKFTTTVRMVKKPNPELPTLAEPNYLTGARVQHNLGTTDVVVQTYNRDTRALVECEVIVVDGNAVNIGVGLGTTDESVELSVVIIG